MSFSMIIIIHVSCTRSQVCIWVLFIGIILDIWLVFTRWSYIITQMKRLVHMTLGIGWDPPKYVHQVFEWLFYAHCQFLNIGMLSLYLAKTMSIIKKRTCEAILTTTKTHGSHGPYVRKYDLNGYNSKHIAFCGVFLFWSIFMAISIFILLVCHTSIHT